MFHLIIRKIVPAALLGALWLSSMMVFSGASVGVFAEAKDDDQAASFAKCWEYASAPDLSVNAVTDGSNVYFVDTERKLQAVDQSAGAKLWSSELAGNVVSNLVVADDAIIVATQTADAAAVTPANSLVRSVSRQTGITNWSTEMSSSTLALGYLGGSIYVVSSTGSIAAFTADKGLPVWKKEIGAKVTTEPQSSGRSILIGTDRNEILSVDVSTGQLATVARTGSLPTAVFPESSGRILVGDDRGNLSFISADGKRIWKFRNGARISAITSYDSEFLATSHDNFLYKLSRGGNVEWKRRLSARIGAGPSVVGDTALVATVGDGIVYAIDLSDGKIGNRIEAGEESSVRVVAAKGGFLIVSTKGLRFFGRDKCSANTKTVPGVAPS
jgi:outer membrane protein assembly factor BamB